MKGLRRFIAPFAPDQSGAVEVFCELGGLIVICDAGGCAGNVCGFDEPRWFKKKSAIFSAGLRDMDAILGRDDRMVTKILSAVEKIESNFVAIIGTPVPSVIGTDYKALKRMIQKKSDLPVFTVNTNGTETYEVGVAKAYLELCREFVPEIKKEQKAAAEVTEVKKEQEAAAEVTEVRNEQKTAAEVTEIKKEQKVAAKVTEIKKEQEAAAEVTEIKNGQKFAKEVTDVKKSENILCVWGATPMDTQYLKLPSIQEAFPEYDRILVIGMGTSYDDLKMIPYASKNLVISASGLSAARYLKQMCGIPYETGYPSDWIPDYEKLEEAAKTLGENSEKKVLIVHQQILANAIRSDIFSKANVIRSDIFSKANAIRSDIFSKANVTVWSWFEMDQELMESGDRRIREEDEWMELVREGNYDVIVADAILKRSIPDFTGIFLPLPHFAVSGTIYE